MIHNKFASHTMSEKSVNTSTEIREKASDLFESIMKVEPGREQSLAITKLEECVMWANKALAMH